ncbi:spectrin beta chain [Anaeramoeba flamelloides]|uniref:Spectrin beta chain n=1 Tax=Anaeramoeba flamelloides TaxID=1746091 RepID=A0AAV8A0V7_9EUKA|nr:spectrin beta chain [Anaeramoeba flamelloides]
MQQFKSLSQRVKHLRYHNENQNLTRKLTIKQRKDSIRKVEERIKKRISPPRDQWTGKNTQINYNKLQDEIKDFDLIKQEVEEDEKKNGLSDQLQIHFSLADQVSAFLNLIDPLMEYLDKKDIKSFETFIEKVFRSNKALVSMSEISDKIIIQFCQIHAIKQFQNFLLSQIFNKISKSIFNLLTFSSGYLKGLDYFYDQIESEKELIDLKLLEAVKKITDFIEFIENYENDLSKADEEGGDGDDEDGLLKKEEEIKIDEEMQKVELRKQILHRTPSYIERLKIIKIRRQSRVFETPINFNDQIKNKNVQNIFPNKIKFEKKINFEKIIDPQTENQQQIEITPIINEEEISCQQEKEKEKENVNDKEKEKEKEKEKKVENSKVQDYEAQQQLIQKLSINSLAKLQPVNSLARLQQVQQLKKLQALKRIQQNKQSIFSKSVNIENKEQEQKFVKNKPLGLSKRNKIHYQSKDQTNCQKGLVKVYLDNKSFKTLALTSNQTVRELIERIQKKMLYENHKNFVFVEKIGNIERILNPELKPLFLREFWEESEIDYCRFEYKDKVTVKNLYNTDEKRFIKIYLQNSSYITLLIFPSTLCSDVLQKVCKKLRVDPQSSTEFSIYLKEDLRYCSYSTFGRFAQVDTSTAFLNSKKKKSKNMMNNPNLALNNKVKNTNNGLSKKKKKQNQTLYDLRGIETDENIFQIVNNSELHSKKIIFIFKENKLQLPKKKSARWGQTPISLKRLKQIQIDLGTENDNIQKTNLNNNPNLDNQNDLFNTINTTETIISRNTKTKTNNNDMLSDECLNEYDIIDKNEIHQIHFEIIEKGDKNCKCSIWGKNHGWKKKILSIQGHKLYYFNNYETSQNQFSMVSLLNAQIHSTKRLFQKKTNIIFLTTDTNEDYKFSFRSTSDFNLWQKYITKGIISLNNCNMTTNKKNKNPKTRNLLTKQTIKTINQSDNVKSSMQINCFINWLNFYLVQNENYILLENRKVTNLEKDLEDGLVLLMVYEVLTNEPLEYNLSPTLLLHKMKNLKIFFDQLRTFTNFDKEKYCITTEESVLDGNLNLILNLIWFLIYHVENYHTSKDELLTWVKKKVDSVSDLSIQDFNSFKNPDLFLLLLYSLRYNSLESPQKLFSNQDQMKFQIAFDSIEENLKIPQLLSVKDMLNSFVDQRSIITYLYLIKRTDFEQCEED